VIAEYVADIISCDVSESWVRCFKSHHPELKVKWTSTLERCCASLLNLALVNEFYDLLEDILMKYQIPSENIYNMDEKGIQLSIGQKVKAFVDHDQKDVHSIVDGNCKLITVIETISADGSCLQPLVIFQGKWQDLKWGQNNPCNAR
jgi:hypothetical protein